MGYTAIVNNQFQSLFGVIQHQPKAWSDYYNFATLPIHKIPLFVITSFTMEFKKKHPTYHHSMFWLRIWMYFIIFHNKSIWVVRYQVKEGYKEGHCAFDKLCFSALAVESGSFLGIQESPMRFHVTWKFYKHIMLVYHLNSMPYGLYETEIALHKT